MREVDRIAVEETDPNLYHMMENAGHNPGPRSHGTIPPLCAALVEHVEFRWIPHRLLSPPHGVSLVAGRKGRER